MRLPLLVFVGIVFYNFIMNLSVGIVGLPNVGKSTLFRALTNQEVDISNYPFATIDPNVGIVAVPDERMEKLAEVSRSQKLIPATVEFVDIAGIVRGANKGEGLGNQFLSHIREVHAIVYVIRAFSDSSVHHVEGRVDPKDDVGIITTEFALKDLETVQKRLRSVRKEEKGGKKGAKEEREVLEEVEGLLEEGGHIQNVRGDLDLIKHLQLLMAKPGIFVINSDTQELQEDVRSYLKTFSYPILVMDVKEEYEGSGFSNEERKELGMSEAKLHNLIRTAYTTLRLITFFTTGEKETRAWTTEDGTNAKEAAGVIHTDFSQSFIAAQVVSYEELISVGGWGEARTKGRVRSEGKEYIVQDGDVLIIMHNA